MPGVRLAGGLPAGCLAARRQKRERGALRGSTKGPASHGRCAEHSRRPALPSPGGLLHGGHRELRGAGVLAALPPPNRPGEVSG